MSYEDNYLAHYGVHGQKWGVRRYQDKNGQLTELGKKHYSEDFTKLTRPTRLARNFVNAEKSIDKMTGNQFKRQLQLNILKKKHSEEMSDPESKASKKAQKLQENIEAYKKRIDFTSKFQALVLSKAFAEGYTRKFKRLASRIGLDLNDFKYAAKRVKEDDLIKEHIKAKTSA